MTQQKALSVVLALATLSLLIFGLSGCYTMLRHPASEPITSGSGACYDCHSGGTHIYSPYVRGWYSSYYGPWYDYYAYPWWAYDPVYVPHDTHDPSTPEAYGHGFGRGGRGAPTDDPATRDARPSQDPPPPRPNATQDDSEKPKKEEKETEGQLGGRGGRR